MKHVGEVGLWIDAAELAGLDQRVEDRPVLAAAIGIGEQGILAIERKRADGSLNRVGVELDASVIEEAREALPTREGVTDGLGDRAFLRDVGELGFLSLPQIPSARFSGHQLRWPIVRVQGQNAESCNGKGSPFCGGRDLR